MSNVIPAPNNLHGFDCNTKLDAELAKTLRDAGMRFAVRYVSRTTPGHTYDISRQERTAILSAGLALMIVQHVEADGPPGWSPTPEKGTSYGQVAANLAFESGVTRGTSLFLDLEGVNTHVPASIVIEYCNNWHRAVVNGGYHPCLYVGWSSGLSGTQLYRNLRFDRYWGAYNLNEDEQPITRGLCMRQSLQKRVAGVLLDPDVIMPDKLGGVPFLDAPDEFSPE